MPKFYFISVPSQKQKSVHYLSALDNFLNEGTDSKAFSFATSNIPNGAKARAVSGNIHDPIVSVLEEFLL